MFYRKVFKFITLQLAFVILYTGSAKAEDKESLQQIPKEYASLISSYESGAISREELMRKLPREYSSYFYAFSPGGDPMRNLPKEYLEETAKQLKLPTNSRHLRRVLSASPTDDIPPEEKYPQTIIKHIKGDSGERFATPEEVSSNFLEVYGTRSISANNKKAPQSMFENEQKQDSENKSIFNKEELLDLTASLSTRMPTCSSASTHSRNINKANSNSSNDVIFDFIILNPNTPLPSDIEKAFGKEAFIVFYDKNEDNYFSQNLVKYDINCLPARLRATEKMLFIDQGLNALKNYDKSYYGQGILDKKVLIEMKMQ